MNPRSFSHEHLINLTTFEDGCDIPTIARDDPEAFRLGTNLACWDQIENNRYVKFGSLNAAPVLYLHSLIIWTNLWSHIASTYSEGLISVYLNGQLMLSSQVFKYGIATDTLPSTEGQIVHRRHHFMIGGRMFPNTDPLNGADSSFVLYNSAPSNMQIQNLPLLLRNSCQNMSVLYSNWVDCDCSFNMVRSHD